MTTNISAKTYVYISSAWTELNDVQPLRAFWGMSDNRPASRLADVGELTFALDNSSGLYTPGGATALSGWQKGLPVKLVVTFEGQEFVRFRGNITDIQIRPAHKDKKAYITVSEWLDYSARHPVVNPAVQTNKRGDQVITTLLTELEVQPQAQSLGTGIETFPTAFDDVKDQTTAYAEFAKIALSELGYIYVTKDRTNGETLVFEGADARHGWITPDTRSLTTYTVDPNPGFLLLETGDKLLLETGDKLILDADIANNYSFDGTMDGNDISDFDAVYGQHVINRMTVYAYPRRLSASNEILFQLDKEFVIAAGNIYILKGTYADPDGGLPINGQSMVTPVATTDYTMFSGSGGTGSDLTANLSVVITYGAEGFTATLTNTSTTTAGYVNKFNTRGIGIYKYNPIDYVENNTVSSGLYGMESDSMNQKYQTTLYSAIGFSKSVVDEYRNPITVLNSIIFCANKTTGCMLAFLYNDVGDMIYIDAPEIGVEGNHYIQGVELIINGGIAMVKWILIAALSLQAGLSPLQIEFNGGAATDSIDYGPVTRANDLTNKTIAVWIYPDSGATGSDIIMANLRGFGGWHLYINHTVTSLYFTQAFDGVNDGYWNSPAGTPSLGARSLIVVTYNSSSTTNDPIIYINGSSVSVTEAVTPVGTVKTELGAVLTIGNNSSTYGFAFDGKIFDPRVYNRILSAAEVTTLYNSGTPDETLVTSGLVFQGFNVRTGDLADYTDQTLTSALKVRDNIFGAIGTPGGSPIGRSAP